MVVFTCNHCGESLQKPRVEKHYNFQCRRPKSLTCVDCFKDFKNEEYTVHTKCVTEEERYAAKGSIPGGVVKKGDVKQESWTDMIKSIVENEQSLKSSLKTLFHTLSTYSNVPRKKAKFINFLKSSTGGRVNFGDIEAAWDLIEKHKSEQNGKTTEIKENGTKHKLDEEKNGCNGEGPTRKKKKVKDETKPETNEDAEVPVKKKKKVEEEQQIDSNVFSFKGTIVNILKSKGTISCKKLQKKVLKTYLEETGSEYTEKTIKKYNQKLKKLPDVVIKDDVVSLNI